MSAIHPTQWWLAELDVHGNPTLTDGPHGERGGVEKAAFLINGLGLNRHNRKFACAEVRLSGVIPLPHDTNLTAMQDVAEMVALNRQVEGLEKNVASWQARANAHAEKQMDIAQQLADVTAERDRQYEENVARIAAQAKAENERDAMRADAERWRWFRTLGTNPEREKILMAVDTDKLIHPDPEKLDAMLDAAMELAARHAEAGKGGYDA